MKSYLHSLVTIFVLASFTMAQATPNVSFTASTTSGVFPLAVSFDASATSDSQSGTLQYFWTFGDGNQTNATGSAGRTASNTYTSNGTFTVTLSVLNMTTFQSGSATKTITVNVPTGTYNFPVDATQDAHLKNGTSTNDGNFLKTGAGYVAYLKYNIPSLPGNITGAKLQMTYSFMGGQNGAVAVTKGSNTSWTETNLTNSNRPSSGTSYGNINTNTSTFVYTKTINLSDITEGGIINLILTSSNSSAHNFSSSEGDFVEERPKLILTVNNSNTTNQTFNLALSGTASQSSTGWGGVASRAIDNNTNGNYGGGSVSHTASGSESNTWWKVDLAQTSTINQIVLWNRINCCPTRLSNFTLEVLNFNGAVVWSQFYTDYPDPSLAINLNATGKTIRIRKSGFIGLAEVQVFGSASNIGNLALSGTASQSSTGWGGVASRAIDNNTNGNYGGGSVSHTASGSESNTWWKVDLAQTSDIHRITLWNRINCCPDRLSNFTLEVLNSNGVVVWSQFYADYPDPSLTIDLGATGKTVRVRKSGFIGLAEVQIFGASVANNLALSGTASQSSTGWGGVASRAIDNNTNGNYGGGSVSHTASGSESNTWWKVDLAQTSDIHRITLWNRINCCPDRLSNFTLEVLNSNGAVVWSQFYANYPDPFLAINLSTTGKTVRVRKSGFIGLAEVQVYGVANPAASATTFQSNNRLLVDEINTEKQPSIQIYPNPATDILHIANAQDATSIEVYNIAGKLLKNYKSATDMLQIAHLQAGMYVLVVHQEGEQQILKFVKE